MKGICFRKTETVAILLKKKSIAGVLLFDKMPSGTVLRIFNPTTVVLLTSFSTLNVYLGPYYASAMDFFCENR